MKRGRPRKPSSKRMRSNSAPPVLQSPKKRLKWTNESMIRAMDAVTQGSSVKRAAEQHGVPRTTLRDRISGHVQHGKKPGPEPYLNKEEEEDLANFIEEVAEVGFGKTRKQIKAMVEQTAREKQLLRKQISDGWFRRFLERQPHLCLRRGDRTAAVRMEAMQKKDALDKYFILLKSILDDHDLGGKPGQIYNMDETGIPLDHRSPRVLAKKGSKKVRYCSTGNKSQVTVVGCINAVGQALPPFVVFDAKNLNMQWCVDEVPGTTYGLSDNGWMDMKLFKGWFIKHFLNLVGSARPVLLLMDGHSSHYNLEAVDLAKKNDVILFTLVPHTTHELQPLDTAVYAPLKTNWQDACHCYLQSHPGTVITKYQFSKLFSGAWLKTMVPSNIISGFKCCGIYPFNPKAVLDHDPCCTSKHADSSSQSITTATEGSSGNHHASTESSGNAEVVPVESFTAEEEVLYTTRYTEGYNVNDPKYVAWLRINHPDSDFDSFVPLIDYFPDADLPEEVSVSVDTASTSDIESDIQTLQHGAFSDDLPGSTPSYKDALVSEGVRHRLNMEIPVTTEQTLVTTEQTPVSVCTTPHTRAPVSSRIGSTPSRQVGSCRKRVSHSSDMEAPVDIAESPRTAPQRTSPITISSTSSSTPLSSCKSSSSNVISKYLVQYIPSVVEKRSAETRVTGSRILTSAEGLAILREKEEKKQKEKEGKEKRKQERLKKKKDKEELAKRKAEEKARKVADKGKTLQTRSRQKRVSKSKSITTDEAAATGPSSSLVKDSILRPENDYECTECLGTYNDDITLGNGAEWIQCGCGQWIHEECIVDTMTGDDGTERICSNCIQ